jgi:hypothetical protein
MAQGKRVYNVWWGSPKERDHLEDQGVEGRMGSEWILGRLAVAVNWIRLAQDRDRRRAIVISRSINIDVSLYLDRLISIYINQLISMYLDRYIDIS